MTADVAFACASAANSPHRRDAVILTEYDQSFLQMIQTGRLPGMSELRKALANPPMYLDDRLPDGHIVVCMGGGTEHSFLRRRLGVSVECPICGQFALSVDLVADFYRRSHTVPAWAGGTRSPR